MSIVMQLQDVAESTRLGPLSGEVRAGEILHLVGPNGAGLAAVVLQITPQANPAGQLLLLDEPMNSLDVAQQSALDKILSALCQQGLAIVMSSHDLNHTLRHAHRAWLLKGGKMLASGRREEVLTPPNLAQAYGMNFRRLDIEGHRMLISTI